MLQGPSCVQRKKEEERAYFKIVNKGNIGETKLFFQGLFCHLN